MADALRTPSLEWLLTALTKSVDEFSDRNDPQDCADELHMLVSDLKDLTSDLKSCSSDWKAATGEAEESKKQQAEMKLELEQRREKMDEEEKRLRRREVELEKRESELEKKERLFKQRNVDLEKKEQLLQQQSAELKQTEQDSRDKEARLQAEATAIASKESELERSYKQWKQESDDALLADKRRSTALMRREDHIKAAQQHLKATQETVLAMNENVNMSLAAVKEEHDKDKRLLEVVKEKHLKMKKLRQSLVQVLNACSAKLDTIRFSALGIAEFEAQHTEEPAGLREEINSLTTALEKQAEKARDIPNDIQAAENDFNHLVTKTERDVGKISTSISMVLRGVDKVTEASAKLDEVSVMIGNVSTGLEELSAKFQQFQPSTNEALQELTVALSKARGDAALQQSILRFEANKAKRGLGPISPEKPVSKHRRRARQSSVGAAEMLTTFGPPESLPEDIAERIPSPRGLGRVVRAENTLPEVGSPPPLRRRTGTSGGLNLLDSSTGSQTVLREQASSSMDPATATEQTASEHAATSMPAPSSPGTLLQSSQSTVSATAPKGLEEATDEVKDVWRQIEFPENWDLSASDTLLRGLKKNINKNVPKHFRPAGLLDSSSAKPNCVIRRLHKVNSKIDNEDGKRCSTCKKFDAPCTQAFFVTADLANVAYNAQGQEKRWKLKIRED